jgi:hypothetical protein
MFSRINRGDKFYLIGNLDWQVVLKRFVFILGSRSLPVSICYEEEGESRQGATKKFTQIVNLALYYEQPRQATGGQRYPTRMVKIVRSASS